MQSRVTMIGDAGCGKTSFMVAAYNALTSGICDISIRAKEEQDHDSLIRLGKRLRNGQYPPATSIRDEYNFSVFCQGSPVIDFMWSDYRGADIYGSGYDNDVLVKEVAESDAFIVFINGLNISQKRYEKYERYKELAINLVKKAKTRILENAVDEIDTEEAHAIANKKVIPILFVITKTDLISNWKRDRRVCLIKDELHNTFSRFKFFHSYVLGTSIGRRSSNSVVLPLMIAILGAINWRQTCIGQLIGRREDQLEVAHKRHNSFFTALFGNKESAYFDVIARSILLNEEKNNLAKLTGPCNKIQRYINDNLSD